MSEKKDKKNNSYYFVICMGIGLTFGIMFDKLAIGLALGVVLGHFLDNRKSNKC